MIRRPASSERDNTGVARILVADDSAAVRLMVSRQLRSDGYDVVEASNGQSAESTGLEGHLDAAVLDQLMPGRRGLDVLHTWRSSGIDIPVVVLSAVDDDDLIDRVLAHGRSDYVRKPFNLAVLTSRLARLL